MSRRQVKKYLTRAACLQVRNKEVAQALKNLKEAHR